LFKCSYLYFYTCGVYSQYSLYIFPLKEGAYCVYLVVYALIRTVIMLTSLLFHV